jgi:cation:H+ antiporter
MSAGVVVLLLGGLGLLAVGGELLVRGSSGIASALGMSRLVVGLTVVSIATSAPEFAVTMQAVTSGSPGLAVGNVVGSNIANVLLVLGVAAAITPLTVKSRIVKLDVPVMIGLSVLVTIFAINGVIASWQGALLMALLAVYLLRAISLGRRDEKAETQALLPDWNDQTGESGGEQDVEVATASSLGPRMMAADIGLIIVGVTLLVFGAQLLVDGATRIAVSVGLSDVIVGLTVVAIGTSLPELATAVVAVLRGETDLAVGNAIGSSIFNLGAVLGFAALISPGGISIPESAAHFDFIVMTAVAVLLLPVVYTGRAIARWEGWLFLGYYAAYLLYLLLASSQHDALKPFSFAMLIFVVPITVVVLITLVVSDRQSRVGAGSA